jgi:hypothetical protein
MLRIPQHWHAVHGRHGRDLNHPPALQRLHQAKVKDAIAARKAQAMTGHPTDAQFVEMVRNNTIKNCPIKPAHITNALTIFGPSIAGVRGRTVFCKPEQVEAGFGRIPDDFHCLHRFVVITANLGWEFRFLVLISGTPIGSGIPDPFTIPKIPVGKILIEFRC